MEAIATRQPSSTLEKKLQDTLTEIQSLYLSKPNLRTRSYQDVTKITALLESLSKEPWNKDKIVYALDHVVTDILKKSNMDKEDKKKLEMLISQYLSTLLNAQLILLSSFIQNDVSKPTSPTKNKFLEQKLKETLTQIQDNVFDLSHLFSLNNKQYDVYATTNALLMIAKLNLFLEKKKELSSLEKTSQAYFSCHYQLKTLEEDCKKQAKVVGKLITGADILILSYTFLFMGGLMGGGALSIFLGSPASPPFYLAAAIVAFFITGVTVGMHVYNLYQRYSALDKQTASKVTEAVETNEKIYAPERSTLSTLGFFGKSSNASTIGNHKKSTETATPSNDSGTSSQLFPLSTF